MILKKIALITLSVPLFISCSPRDEPAQGSGRGNEGIELASGQIVTVDKKGERSSTCGDEGAKDWTDIRMFNELSMAFEKAKKNQLSIFVNKKGRSCVRIGSQLELAIQETPDSGNPKGIGVFVEATKVLIMNTEDLLKNTKLMNEFADGMGLSVGELEAYLKDRYNEQLNITYFKPVGGSKKPVDGDDGNTNEPKPPGSSLVSILKSPNDDGKTISDCGEQKWSSLRVQNWFLDEHKQILVKAIEDQTLKVFVGAGKNCLPVGATAHFEAAVDDGEFAVVGGEYKVSAVIERSMEDFANDPVLTEYVAEDMGMTPEEFMNFLANIKNEKVNMTFIDWKSSTQAEEL